MLIIGLDAASQWYDFGFAIGRIRGGTVAIEQAGLIGTRDNPTALASIIAPLLRASDRALVAIDAPLGWPAALRDSLAVHKAGEKIAPPKDEMFCRETDRWVKTQIGKTALEVGADKIARAAYAALEALGILRELSGQPIPLAWDSRFSGTAAIEVYPAATLMARGFHSASYKDQKNKEKQAESMKRRSEIAAGLKSRLTGLEQFLREKDDVFDACLCLAAAQDFLEGRAMPPVNRANAEREGWIWVRSLAQPPK